MSVSAKQWKVGSAIVYRKPDARGAGAATVDSELPTSTDLEIPSRDPESAAHRVLRDAEHVEYHDTIPAPPPDDFDDGD
jgi:hypothetical protein